MTFCAIDFGTSNSTVGVWRAGTPRLLSPEPHKQAVPTALFFPAERGSAPVCGNAAVQAYLNEDDGRFMRGVKGVLGTALFAETTLTSGKQTGFVDIIGGYLEWLIGAATAELGQRPTQLMLGRPAHFLTNEPDADAVAETQLREVAAKLGITDVAFMLEPLAAAWHYESTLSGPETALIVDIGGGTGDFTVIRLDPTRSLQPDRTADILASHGLRLGGSGIDQALSLAHVMPLFGYGTLMQRGDLTVPATTYNQLTTWHRIHNLYNCAILTELRGIQYGAAEPDKIGRLMQLLEDRLGHRLSYAVEEAKQRLSHAGETSVDLEWFERNLSPGLHADQLATTLQKWLTAMHEAITHTLQLANLPENAITSVFLTGGPSAMPLIRSAVQQRFPQTRMVHGDLLTSVGNGLILAAHRHFASRL